MTNTKVPYKLLIQILFLTPKPQSNSNPLLFSYLKRFDNTQFEVDRRLFAMRDE
ncbi:hypothetical protein M892_06465 [Vibrio campbellii ATCC BAA-1116]|nr:hypothetical protein M892_06465 [Vibrio campbellii ATCC BAA-1116]